MTPRQALMPNEARHNGDVDDFERESPQQSPHAPPPGDLNRVAETQPGKVVTAAPVRENPISDTSALEKRMAKFTLWQTIFSCLLVIAAFIALYVSDKQWDAAQSGINLAASK